MSSLQFFPVHTDKSQWAICGKKFLTASDAGTVLGLNPYKAPDTLMAEKLGLKQRDPAGHAVMWGLHHEKEALEALEDKLGIGIESPCGLYVRDGWLGAIPDGLVWRDGRRENGSIVEIKSRWAVAKKGKGLKPISGCDRSQVQVQLHCTGREACYFYQWAPSSDMLDIVERDDAWLDENLPKLRAFYDEWQDMKGKVQS